MNRLVLALVFTASTAPPAIAQTNPLWHEEKIKNFLPHMTWPEVRDLLTRTDIVLIPVPSIEQHGPQTPMGTDYYAGVEEAQPIAQRTDVLVAPVLRVGQSPYHMEFPGTMTLSSETIQRVYFEAAQSLIHHGFRRFLFGMPSPPRRRSDRSPPGPRPPPAARARGTGPRRSRRGAARGAQRSRRRPDA